MNNGMFGLPPGLPPVSGLGLGQGVGPTFMYQKVKAYCKPGTYTTERVPDRVKTILVMVFGGGGNGSMASSGYTPYAGAGGGFAMAEFPVTPGELLPSIIVGGSAGASSFGQFLTATGGSHASSSAHGTGGVAAAMSGLRNVRIANGGSPTGGFGSFVQGGGASGSPYGNGAAPGINQSGGGGWTIYGSLGSQIQFGGSGLYAANIDRCVGGGGSASSPTGSYGENGGDGCIERGGFGVYSNNNNQLFDLSKQVPPSNLLDILRLREVGGGGGGGIYYYASSRPVAQNTYRAGHGGPGAGGGGIILQNTTNSADAVAGNGGIGGGGGGMHIDYTWKYLKAGDGGFGGGGGGMYASLSNAMVVGGDGGIGGGGGGVYGTGGSITPDSRAGRGGGGAVLIYYTEGN